MFRPRRQQSRENPISVVSGGATVGPASGGGGGGGGGSPGGGGGHHGGHGDRNWGYWNNWGWTFPWWLGYYPYPYYPTVPLPYGDWATGYYYNPPWPYPFAPQIPVVF